MKREHFILATSSKARRRLIRNAGFAAPIRFVSPDVDETVLRGERAEAHVKRLAGAKACSVKVRRHDTIVIGVDTVVTINGEIIGKPRSAAHAKKILRKLSGRWHTIMSGVAIRDVRTNRVNVCVVKTRVKFVKLTARQIDRYVKTREPFGKAGGYAIQGKGAALVDEIHGSLTNVIGLPIETLKHLVAVCSRLCR